MLIQGTSNTNNHIFIAKKIVDLMNENVSLNQILVLTLNSYKKANLLNEIYKLNPNLKTQKLNVHTLFGLCYNAFLDNWEFISNLINQNQTQQPNLCGLEVSQYIFKQSIKVANFSDYISKINLLHQLFRRYSLIVQNNLTNDEVQKRSKLLNETFYLDAQKTIEDYKRKTIQYESFDYLRQLAILPIIYNKTDYFKDVKYLFVDEADEISYAFWQFIEKLLPQLKDYFIFYDKDGSSRCGYLCAYKSGVFEFIKNHSPKIIEQKDNSKFFNIANDFASKIKKGEKLSFSKFKNNISAKRLDMFEVVHTKVKNLLQNGVKATDIAIITPVIDEVLISNLQSKNVKYQVLSGNEKLYQNETIKNIIVILKLINNLPVKDYELKSLLINYLKIPYLRCQQLLKKYSENKVLENYLFKEENYNFLYQKLLALINAETKVKNDISVQIKIIYENLLKDSTNKSDKEKYDFLLKEAKSFEVAFSSKFNLVNPKEEFIKQIENSVISENPIESFSVEKNCVFISTPQKIIDFSIKTKYQLWLDISNSEWQKQDTGTLYNAWVLSRDWEKDKYTLEDNINLTRDKTARMIRKLMLCATDEILFFSSIYDNTGNENFGGLTDFIDAKIEPKVEFKITPRDDQKPVLDYKKGKMGIMAVPGAGKTTILLALIIKLIKDGIKPENIFVLTYMEAAAKNFKERIKSAIPDNLDLPNISTIHGLALRIIKENGNYTKVGLDENFEICDDTTKEKIIKELFFKLKIDEDKYENYLRCISIVKLSTNSDELHSKYKEIQDFYNFLNEYNLTLKKNNIIDYDDMLCFAVKILEKNQEILKYYQNICKYIIEDEAQDSTNIQQKLISLLNGKYNNIVRCGDINQAITSTFTNSDLESFKNFINKSQKVEMVSSQRCSKEIYSLANKLISQSFQENDTKNAFYKIEMKGTNKNPISEKKPQYLFFENQKEERAFILQEINEILKENPKASIAILLRLNSQVNEYNEFFLENGIKTSIRSDCLAQKNIYKIIFAVLNVVKNPLNNNSILELAKQYKHNNIYIYNENIFNYIKELKTPFMLQNIDDINDEGLLQLYFDVDYWLNNSSTSCDIFALNIGLYYSKNAIDKSNSYMVSTIIKRLMNDTDNLNEIISKLDYSAQKSLSAYKFFEEETKEINKTPISIMTMHKSKGDEFDFVFIPELNEENYSINITNVKIKNGGHFVQTIKNLVENSPIKDNEKLKKEQIEETLRLLYVGITRAKLGLYLTNAKDYKKRKNTKPVQILNKIIVAS
jgi:DNA helicase-2/ATP-dependent DNA helicase PcrA